MHVVFVNIYFWHLCCPLLLCFHLMSLHLLSPPHKFPHLISESVLCSLSLSLRLFFSLPHSSNPDFSPILYFSPHGASLHIQLGSDPYVGQSPSPAHCVNPSTDHHNHLLLQPYAQIIPGSCNRRLILAILVNNL